MVLLRRMGVLPQMHRLLSLAPLDEQLAAVRRLRPQVINGYSIALERLAEAALAAGVEDIRPRLVYTGSMPTSDRCRMLVQQAFGVRPLDVYAMVEAGPLASECPDNPGEPPERRRAVAGDRGRVGRRVPDGETGRWSSRRSRSGLSRSCAIA